MLTEINILLSVLSVIVINYYNMTINQTLICFVASLLCGLYVNFKILLNILLIISIIAPQIEKYIVLSLTIHYAICKLIF